MREALNLLISPGVSIRYCSFEGASENIWHILVWISTVSLIMRHIKCHSCVKSQSIPPRVTTTYQARAGCGTWLSSSASGADCAAGLYRRHRRCPYRARRLVCLVESHFVVMMMIVMTMMMMISLFSNVFDCISPSYFHFLFSFPESK